MKIVVLTNLYPPIYFGGYELECHDIAEGLAVRGHEVTVITSMCGVKSPQVEGNVHRVMRFMPDEIMGEDFASKVAHPATYIKALMRFVSISRHNAGMVGDILDKVRPDVAFVWNMSDLSMAPLQELSNRGVSRVHRIATPWVVDGLRYHCPSSSTRRAVRRLMTGVRNPRKCFTEGLFVAPSDFIGRQLVESGIPQAQVVTVFPHARIPKEMAPPYNGKVFRMLYAGRVCEEKGVHVAIRAAGELAKIAPHADFELDIVGNAPEDYLTQLKQESIDLGIDGRVSFFGIVPREKLEEMRSRYHAFVFTSIWPEPAAGVVIESMAYGLPIIASPAGGTAEYLVHEENALTFPMGDHKAMAAAMKRLIETPELLPKLREGGRNTAFERFEFEKILDLHESYLLSAVGKAVTASSVTESAIGNC